MIQISNSARVEHGNTPYGPYPSDLKDKDTSVIVPAVSSKCSTVRKRVGTGKGLIQAVSPTQDPLERALAELEQQEMHIRNGYLSHDSPDYQFNWKEHVKIIESNYGEVQDVVEWIKKHQYRKVDGRSANCSRDMFEGFVWSNVLLAGGSLFRAYCHYDSNHDFDLYIYGLTLAQAEQKLAMIVKHFATTVNGNGHMRVVRSDTAVTLSWGR